MLIINKRNLFSFILLPFWSKEAWIFKFLIMKRKVMELTRILEVIKKNVQNSCQGLGGGGMGIAG